ncbi:hypothetical protein [Curtobacterium sp. VKM Ac-1395]|jgi:hypothetical protein|uniref:hypothetical protein n=1 Tax=Curtobacterium sp. VKM Ac-1395 TaxID=2783815 RepID=UPI00188A2871|nr:hypothetical protein [Curtobacterium sp. VKM Ac-1395]MBF4590310.1 hypothetical protein [Curtobacterium sp. VKM Ac-1395]
MAPKQNNRSDQRDQAIIPLPSAPIDQTTPKPDVPTTTTGWAKMLDRVIDVQRPVVIAHVNAVRRRHPNASPAEIIQILERQYLAAVTTGGAAVGASAVVPGIGMVASFGLSGAETIGFLETTALFAQSVTEVHGIALDDPERSRTLVMAMILGAPGTQLIKQLAGQAAGGQVRTAFWGEMVASSLPKQAVSGIGKQIRDSFIKRFVARQGTSMLGRALPFGIGAAVGGIGNHALGRKVIQASREGFGLPPTQFPMILDQKAPKQLGRGLPWRRKGKQDDAEDTGDQQRRSDTAL